MPISSKLKSTSHQHSVWLAVILAIAPSMGFGSDRLQPCWIDDFRDYIDRYEQIVSESIQGEVVLSTNVFPSFSAEWTVRIIKRASDYFVVSIQLDDSLWYSATTIDEAGRSASSGFSDAVIDVSLNESPVTGELAAALKVEWAHSISKAQESNLLGLDGVTFTFVLPKGSCGSAWTPSENSRNGQLVQIVKSLRDLSKLQIRSPDRGAEKDILDSLAGLPDIE